MFKNLLIVSFLLLLSTVSFAQNKSVYTPLTNDKCQVKVDSKLPIMNGLCPGVGGYNLAIADDDARMSVSVVAPDKTVFDLDFWGHLRNFSELGEKAEWRMKGKNPIALIIRYLVHDKGDLKPPTSYLMVAKITKDSACVTNIVKPSKSQNLLAQQLADSASNKPCKKTE
ncbi:MAG TPA: hypothetical protein PKY82_09955 [Pyrinomonadaceae bacterium]|nr:hypothetical protein [Pyrinomonadaceae bacterium]